MRVVLDTNVLLSACLKPDGLEARTVRTGLEGTFTICLTNEMEAEYREVLFRPKFAACHLTAEVLLRELVAKSLRVSATERVDAAIDDDDNRFLECAQACAAEFLVTG